MFKAEVSQDNVITAPYADSEYLYTVSAAYITKVPEGAEILAKYGSGADFSKQAGGRITRLHKTKYWRLLTIQTTSM